MIAKKVEKEVFIAEDGKEFLTKQDCLNYEKNVLEELKRIKYFRISHGADFTEGRGFYSSSLIAINEDYSCEEWARMYCQIAFGSQIDWMYHTPAKRWEVYSISEEDYRKGIVKNGKKIFLSDKDFDGFPKSIKISSKTKQEDLIED